MNKVKLKYYSVDENGNTKEIYDMQSLFEVIMRQWNDMEEEVERAKQRVTDYNKDEEIQKWKKRAEYYNSHALHILSDKEQTADREFRDIHYNLHHPIPTKAGGNTFLYELTGTGIGTTITVICPECGERKDITDFTNW